MNIRGWGEGGGEREGREEERGGEGERGEREAQSGVLIKPSLETRRKYLRDL